jgi:DTW domain-containing protein YfiP
MISVDLSRISAYHLREAHADGQYCTAEVAIALLDLAGDKRRRRLASTSPVPDPLSGGKNPA